MLNRHVFRCCAVFVLALTGCIRDEPSRAEFVLGTVCNITLFDQARAQVYRDVFARIREIENHMSVNLPNSDIARINAAAGITPVQVHDDVFYVIERSLYFAGLSGGALDPAVGPLVSLWGIGTDNPRVPSQTEIDSVLPLVNWQNIELDYSARSVFLKQPGMALDLGAIAKGFAADEAAAIIKKAGLKRAIIDLGGDIITSGKKRDRSSWKVGIQDPLDNRGSYIGVVTVGEQGIVTSGVYERYFEAEGERYHHIFSPQRGFPADNDLMSVTIIADNAMDADALSTAVFVLGYEKGRALVDSLDGFQAIFVFRDNNVRITPGTDFVLTSEDYRF
ncbi:MAG: FAD:protein FMN transferase [Treponema sp.]|nr:FAD:protein FMN transferase [Treponema sp.]